MHHAPVHLCLSPGPPFSPVFSPSTSVELDPKCRQCTIILFAVGETAWRLPRVQTVTSDARKLAVPIKFRTLSQDKSKNAIASCIEASHYTHSILIAVARLC